MKQCDLKELTGKMVKGWYEWLIANDCGCCSLYFADTDKYRYSVCMGWHDTGDGKGGKPRWAVAWKIGRQTHDNALQCDLDVDFEMPYVTEAMAKADLELCAGDVDDTLETVSAGRRTTIYRQTLFSAPDGYRSWNALAAQMRKAARRVYREWKGHDE